MLCTNPLDAQYIKYLDLFNPELGIEEHYQMQCVCELIIPGSTALSSTITERLAKILLR